MRVGLQAFDDPESGASQQALCPHQHSSLQTRGTNLLSAKHGTTPLSAGVQNISVEVRSAGAVLGSVSVRPLQPLEEVDVDIGSVANGTRLLVVAVASNGVGLRSEAGQSDEHLVVLSALDAGSAWILDGSGLRQNTSFQRNRFGISVAISGAVDPMDAGAQFAYSWSVVEAPCASSPHKFPKGAVRARLPSGELTAVAGMLLEEGRTYCGLVAACTAPSSSFPSGRCATAMTAGVTIDVSAPLGGVRPLPQRGSAASAMPLTVAIWCSDPHSGVTRLTLSLGLEWGANDLASGLEIAVPLSANGSAATEGGLRVQGRANRTHVAGNVTVSRSMLLTGVADGSAVFASVSCTNAAGMYTAVSGIADVRIDTTSPRAGALHMSSLHQGGDGLLHSDATRSVLLSWDGFSDDGARIVRYIVCVGLAPSACDVEEHIVSTAMEASVSLQMHSLIQRGARSSATVFVSVTAVDGMKRSNSSNVAVLLDWSPPVIGDVSRAQFRTLTVACQLQGSRV